MEEPLLPDDAARTSPLDALVVGAGISGIHLLHRLRELGFRVLVVEAGEDLGGTWYWNRYPGARCDVESLVYSYSWSDELQQAWRWTERYAPQAEILAYLGHVADRFDLRRDMRFSTRVTAARWDDGASRWTVATDGGDELAARFLIMATGNLSVPRGPELAGLERFGGDVYQTALWPREGVDFTGRRVGVVGTGSSGVQVVPEIAREAARLHVFQRTPAFSVPSWNGPLDEEVERDVKAHYAQRRALARETAGGNPWHERPQSVFDATPAERQAEFEARYRVGGFFLHSAYNDLFTDETANEIISDFVRSKIRERVDDPELAEQLCPYDYALATKRMCIDTGYYEAFNRPHVRLVNLRRTPIETVTETGIRVGGASPEEIALDALVLATGFDAMTGALAAVDLRGRDGRALREKWAAGPRTYLGLAHAGFPNLFTITGPSSPSVLSNVMVSIEQHVALVATLLCHLREQGLTSIEPTDAAEQAWAEHHRALGDASLYPRANSWYMGANVPGKPRVLLPYVGGVGRYRKICERVVANGFEGFAMRGPSGRELAVVPAGAFADGELESDPL
jgi:cation diffusion facilitator CzcD-associated flavoprotein CzcO